MAVHGKFASPARTWRTVQRIVYAENECNYCARCQEWWRHPGRSRAVRLLHKSWPRSIDEQTLVKHCDGTLPNFESRSNETGWVP